MGKEIYNIGIIGLGDISQVYLNNLKKYPVVRLLACSCRSHKKAKQLAKVHDIPRPYGSTAELLADTDIDVVLNLTLPEVHGPITLAALEAGKHVYTENHWQKSRRRRCNNGSCRSKNLVVGSAPDTFRRSAAGLQSSDRQR